MTGETVALTYAELADRLGIEVASAKMRARRGKWRREPGNDGKTRVQVPVEVLNEAPPPTLPDPSSPRPVAPLPDTSLAVLREAHAAEIARMEAMHKATMDALRETHAAELARIEAAQQRDREAHRAEVERLRADHVAELARLLDAHQRTAARRPAIEHMRDGLSRAARWIEKIGKR